MYKVKFEKKKRRKKDKDYVKYYCVDEKVGKDMVAEWSGAGTKFSTVESAEIMMDWFPPKIPWEYVIKIVEI